MRCSGSFWARSLAIASFGLAGWLYSASGFAQEIPAAPPVPDVKEPVKDAVEPVKEAAKDAVEPAKDAVEPAKEAVEPAKEAAKDAVEPAKEAAKDAVEPAKDAVKPVRDAARDAVEPARDAARDAAKGARDAVEPARDAARDAARGARDAVEPARDAVRDVREGARDTIRDTRDAARDTIRDTRDAVRDTARDIRGSASVSGSARTSLQAQDLRSADLGLWFSSNARNGLIISDVATTGPIAKLGFQEGDQIVSVAGQPITRQADFTRFLFSGNARGRVPVVLLRGGAQQTIYMEPQVFVTHANSFQSDPLERIGLVLDDRAQDRVLVWRVMPRSPAFFAGVRSGDVIVSFNQQPIEAPAQLAKLAANAEAESGPIALEVQRGDRARTLELDMQASASTGVEARTAMRPAYDSASPVAPAAPTYTVPSGGYSNDRTYSRRGLFRWRR